MKRLLALILLAFALTAGPMAVLTVHPAITGPTCSGNNC